MEEAATASIEAPAAPGASEEAGQGEGKRAFTFPSAYTILFLLLIVVTILTWIIPAGQYDYTPDGSPIPGTYHTVPQNPQRLVQGAFLGPIDGMYGLKDSTGNVSANNSGSPVRCHQRRAVRHRHRRVPRPDDEDRRDRRRDRRGRSEARHARHAG